MLRIFVFFDSKFNALILYYLIAVWYCQSWFLEQVYLGAKVKKNCKKTLKNTDSELLLHNYRFTCSRRKHAWNSRFLFEIAYYYYCDGCDCARRMNAHFCAFYCSDSTYQDNIVKHYPNIDTYHFLFKTQLVQFRSKKVLLQNFNNSKLLLFMCF